MKVIKYLTTTTVTVITEDGPVLENLVFPVELSWSEANEEIAKREAHNSEYVIEEIPDEEPPMPTQLDIIEAQVAYTAMMTNTLLEV